ncbi:HTH domain-containing protein [Nibribacter koreensis]|uniref:HTH deoR-type domain-containing protein n=1 Tax=Nibribacter koreensis TaxID=1084519 RepID=A0ABP8FB63_9BACT
MNRTQQLLAAQRERAAFIKANPRLTIQQLANALGVNRGTIREDLIRMEDPDYGKEQKPKWGGWKKDRKPQIIDDFRGMF